MSEGPEAVMARPPSVALMPTSKWEQPFQHRYIKMWDTASLTLGRYISSLPTNSNGVLNYPFISRQHAKIEYRDGRFYLTDLGSTNGTYLNKTFVAKNEKVKLKSMDILTLGELDGPSENKLTLLVHVYYPRYEGDWVPDSQVTPSKGASGHAGDGKVVEDV